MLSIAISVVISRCQPAARTSISPATTTTVATTAILTAFATQSGGGSTLIRGRMYLRNNHSSTQPTPYPRAALMPLIKPWNSQSRGNSDGVTDHEKNSSATARPT